ncbi:MAG: hypothetical protein HZB55_08205 [Deltaproteobacteria bacterium]|nr:hypothetical protein [Deltaproteobacteria bacterium]
MYHKNALVRHTGIAVALVLLFAWAGVAADAPQGADARRDVLYVCNCGPECKCNSVSTQPGKCACGSALKWSHVVKIEGNDALLCMCDEGCKCSIDPKDPTKCGCGKALKRVSLKGTGIYFCNCGGSCTCNTVSDKPGKCSCGMDLKKVD